MISAVAGGALTMVSASASAPALAYGPEHLYEVTLSYNCENAAICASTPFGIGGIWGWLEPDAGTDPGSGLPAADGELEFQGHSNANQALNGHGHTVAIKGYVALDCSAAMPPPDCALVAVEGVPADPNGQYFEFVADFGTAGVFPVLTPATPGHYGVHPAPGVSSQATVAELH